MKTVIFDLDGTLADTGEDLVAAANACFREMGYGDQLSSETDRRTAMIGGGRAMLRLGFDRMGHKKADREIEEYYPLLLSSYAENIDTHTTMYPGATDAIREIADSGYAVGVCTNKPEVLAEELLSRLGVRDLFASMIGADTLPVRKPDPQPLLAAIELAGGDRNRSILVGDSITDRKTATAAEVKSLLVTFGPDGDGVSELNPDGLLHRYDDLQEAVQRLIG